jgi:hypothetical protein
MDEGKLLAMKEVNPTLCTVCGLSVQSKPYLMKCDLCKSAWHLDCLDPLTRTDRPPVGATEQKVGNRVQFIMKKKYFMCPRHVSQDLQHFSYPSFTEDYTNITTRGFKIRSFAEPRVIETAIDRGHRNDGENIEVELDEESDQSSSDDEDTDEGFVEGANVGNVTHKMREYSIKQDFFVKVKRYDHFLPLYIYNINLLLSIGIALRRLPRSLLRN